MKEKTLQWMSAVRKNAQRHKDFFYSLCLCGLSYDLWFSLQYLEFGPKSGMLPSLTTLSQLFN